MSSLRLFAAMLAMVSLALCAPGAFAQSGGAAPQEQQKPANDAAAAKDAAAKDGQKKIDEIAEATRTLVGPAGNPECVWLGRRVVSLLWRDDLDTAFRHLDLYDRFGCPSATYPGHLPLHRPAGEHRSEGARNLERPRPRLLAQPGTGSGTCRRRQHCAGRHPGGNAHPAIAL